MRHASKPVLSTLVIVSMLIAVGCGGGGTTFNASTSGGGGNSGGGGGGNNGGGGSSTNTTATLSITDIGDGYPLAIADDNSVLYEKVTGSTIAYFLYKGGNSSALPTPPNGGVPTATGMNSTGTVLVNTTLGGGPADSYLLSNGTYTLLQQPSSQGIVKASGKVRSSVSRAPVFYQGVSLTNNGKVLSTGNFVWDTPSTTHTYTQPANFYPLAMNSSGTIVGAVSKGFQVAEYYKVDSSGATDLGYGLEPDIYFAMTPNAATVSDSGIVAIQVGYAVKVFPTTGSVQQASFIASAVGVPSTAFGATSVNTNKAGQFVGTDIPFPNASGGAKVYFPGTGVTGSLFTLDSSKNKIPLYTADALNNNSWVVGRYAVAGNANTIHMYLAQLPSDLGASQGVKVSISSDVTLEGGGVNPFSATVSGASDQTVTWVVAEGSAGGSIDSGGHYTAPLPSGTYHVTATSKADATVTATATVKVISIGATGAYKAPVAISGPAIGFVITQALGDGEMVGYSKDSPNPKPLYWSSPTSTPTVLSLGTGTGASATGLAKVGAQTQIVGLIGQSSSGLPCYWATPTSAPVTLNEATSIAAAPSINTYGQVVSGTNYWSSITSDPQAMSTYDAVNFTRYTKIADNGSIAVLGQNPLIYSSFSATPVALGANGATSNLATVMSQNSAVIGGLLQNVGVTPVTWQFGSYGTPSTLLPAPPFADAYVVSGIGNSEVVMGSVNYHDGTSGIGLWNGTNFSDVRALMAQGTGWKLSSGLYLLSDSSNLTPGSVIAYGTNPSGTASYCYVKGN